MSNSIAHRQVAKEARGVGRILALFYGVFCYLIFYSGPKNLHSQHARV